MGLASVASGTQETAELGVAGSFFFLKMFFSSVLGVELRAFALSSLASLSIFILRQGLYQLPWLSLDSPASASQVAVIIDRHVPPSLEAAELK